MTDSSMIPLVLFLALLAAGCQSDSSTHTARTVPEQTLTVAFYNVENLFDPADDPTIAGDDEFTPAGDLKWTNERLERKLEGIARAIRAFDEYRGADVVGLAEVENRAVLERLVRDFLPAGQYAIVHTESPDERGIDVALLYRPSALTHLGTAMHRVHLAEGERPTRDVMEATFEREGQRLSVLVNHWPSRTGGAEQTEPKRIAAAHTAAAVVDSLLALDPAADVILLGDFNDEPGDRSVGQVLDGAELTEPFRHRMINLAAPVARADSIGSYLYRGDWETIDQILVSRGALDHRGLMLYETSQTIFTPGFLVDERAEDGRHPAKRTYRGRQYVGGTSDHFPVVARFGWGS